jgi:hypothetical protein
VLPITGDTTSTGEAKVELLGEGNPELTSEDNVEPTGEVDTMTGEGSVEPTGEVELMVGEVKLMTGEGGVELLAGENIVEMTGEGGVELDGEVEVTSVVAEVEVMAVVEVEVDTVAAGGVCEIVGAGRPVSFLPTPIVRLRLGRIVSLGGLAIVGCLFLTLLPSSLTFARSGCGLFGCVICLAFGAPLVPLFPYTLSSCVLVSPCRAPEKLVCLGTFSGSRVTGNLEGGSWPCDWYGA